MELGVCGSQLKQNGFVDRDEVWFASIMRGAPARHDDVIGDGAGISFDLGTERSDAVCQDAEQMCLAIAGVSGQDDAAPLGNMCTNSVIKVCYGVKTSKIVD